jgi:hypothetical protein
LDSSVAGPPGPPGSVPGLASGYIAYGNSGGTGLTGSNNLTFNGSTLDINSYLRFPNGGNSQLGAYETGSWSPQLTYGTFGGSGLQYANALSAGQIIDTNRYTRIGNVVFFTLYISFTGLSASGLTYPCVSIPIAGSGYTSVLPDPHLFGFPVAATNGNPIVEYRAHFNGSNGIYLSANMGALFGITTSIILGVGSWPTNGSITLSGFYYLI